MCKMGVMIKGGEDKPNVGRVLASRDKRQGEIWMRTIDAIILLIVIVAATAWVL